jgi:hypothetical protein
VLAAARANPDTLHLGLDTNIAALRQAARAARRKPARGGAPNAAFVAGSFADLPGPLAATADNVTIYLPWGSLLAALLSAEGARVLHALVTPGAFLDLVVSYDPARDAAEWQRLAIDPRALDDPTLERTYAIAGWTNTRLEPMSPAQLKTLGTTWASRLSQGAGRRTWRLRATTETALPHSARYVSG